MDQSKSISSSLDIRTASTLRSVPVTPRDKVLASACWVLPIVAVVVMLTEHRWSRFVRDHAVLGLSFCLGWMALGVTHVWLEAFNRIDQLAYPHLFDQMMLAFIALTTSGGPFQYMSFYFLSAGLAILFAVLLKRTPYEYDEPPRRHVIHYLLGISALLWSMSITILWSFGVIASVIADVVPFAIAWVLGIGLSWVGLRAFAHQSWLIGSGVLMMWGIGMVLASSMVFIQSSDLMPRGAAILSLAFGGVFILVVGVMTLLLRSQGNQVP